MDYYNIADSDLKISRLTLGCWAFAGGDLWGEQSLDDSVGTVLAALDLGINVFDTAPAYGNGLSEEVLGTALSGRRDEALIFSKVSTKQMAGADLVASCEESLKRLKTDHLDVLQVHWPSREVAVLETAEALMRLQKDGKIRYAGVCNCGVEDLSEYAEALNSVVVNQLPYSLLSRGIEFDVLPKCRELKVPVLAYSPLLQGLLSGKFETVDEVPTGRRRSRHFSGSREETRHGEEGCEVETFAALAAIRGISDELGISMTHLSLSLGC